MPTTFSDIELSFEFVSSEGGSTHEAFLCRRTGKIYWRSDSSDDLNEEEMPDDVEDEEKHIAIPGKRELDLGKPLVMDFAREFPPNDFDEVLYMFSNRGAYKKFRACDAKERSRSVVRIRIEGNRTRAARMVRAQLR